LSLSISSLPTGIRYDNAKEESQIDFCLDLYIMDKEIRHRGHTNVIVFAFAALKALFATFEAGQDGSVSEKAAGAVEGRQPKSIRSKVMRVLEQIRQDVWWVAYAHLILKNVKQDRAKARLGLEEEQAAIKALLDAVENAKGVEPEEAKRLKRAVRLAVERNLEERVNNKKVTVGGRATRELCFAHTPPIGTPHSLRPFSGSR
jgi:hypothetical protein